MGWDAPRDYVSGSRFDSRLEVGFGMMSASLTLNVRTKLWDPWQSGQTLGFDRGTGQFTQVSGTPPSNVITSQPYTPQEKAGYERRFKELIESFLDNVFLLTPIEGSSEYGAPPIRCRINIMYVRENQDAHLNAMLFHPPPSNRRAVPSRVQQIGGQLGNRYPNDWDALISTDGMNAWDPWQACRAISPTDANLLGMTNPAACPTTASGQAHYSALHEFMHYLGFSHSGYLDPRLGGLALTNATSGAFRQQYGHPAEMPDAWRDIMGAGSDLFHYHALPWIRRLEEHGVLASTGGALVGDSIYGGGGASYEVSVNHTSQQLPARPLTDVVRAYEVGMRSCQRCNQLTTQWPDSDWMWEEPQADVP